MSYSSKIDLEKLMKPFAEENPSGNDVRYTRYDDIKEARREVRGSSVGDWGNNKKSCRLG